MNERTVGFTPETMPENAATDENYRDYILGAYDGVPKTPEWASEICGTPIDDITWYAELAAKDNKVVFFHSYAASRCLGAENLPQAFMTVSALGGHYGKSGQGGLRLCGRHPLPGAAAHCGRGHRTLHRQPGGFSGCHGSEPQHRRADVVELSCCRIVSIHIRGHL